MFQREAMRERPARRRGIADSESCSSASAASSSDSDADEEPPTKKKSMTSVCSVQFLFAVYYFVIIEFDRYRNDAEGELIWLTTGRRREGVVHFVLMYDVYD